jgi:import receptor subunit TOM70
MNYPTSPRNPSSPFLPRYSPISPVSLQTRKEYALLFKNAGNKTYTARKFNEAIELYTNAILCDADPVFYSNRAACYAALKQHDKTIADASAALALNPDYSKALRRRAHAYEEIGHDAEALSDWTAACIVEEFKFNDGTTAVQRVLKRLADTKAADRLANRPRKLPSASFVLAYLSSFRPKTVPQLPENPSEGDYAFQRAMQFVENAEFNEASDEFDTAIRLGCKELPLALNYSGTFSFIRGDTDIAIEEFNKSLALEPNQSQVWAKRASVMMEKGTSLHILIPADRVAAMEDFAKAIEIDPSDPDVYYHRGQVRFLMGDFSDAAADYKKSAELDGKFVYSQVQLGVAQYKLGQQKDALVTFRKCIKQFKNSAEVYNYYGEILLDMGSLKEAEEKFDTAIELERASAAGKKVRNVMPLVNRAVLHLQKDKNPKQAEMCLREALKCIPPLYG